MEKIIRICLGIIIALCGATLIWYVGRFSISQLLDLRDLTFVFGTFGAIGLMGALAAYFFSLRKEINETQMIFLIGCACACVLGLGAHIIIIFFFNP